jgi:DNA-directed RNA polymerase subunit N (RpoN/RPB10)
VAMEQQGIRNYCCGSLATGYPELLLWLRSNRVSGIIAVALEQQGIQNYCCGSGATGYLELLLWLWSNRVFGIIAVGLERRVSGIITGTLV